MYVCRVPPAASVWSFAKVDGSAGRLAVAGSLAAAAVAVTSPELLSTLLNPAQNVPTANGLTSQLASLP